MSLMSGWSSGIIPEPWREQGGKKGKGRGWEGRRRDAGLGLKDLFSWTPCAQVAKWDTGSGRGLSSLFLCNYQNS